MDTKSLRRGAQVAVLAGMFATGFLCGSINHNQVDAQMGELGKQALEKAGESGGALGSAAELGTAVVDMQEHVDALQKNINTLKKIKSALGG